VVINLGGEKPSGTTDQGERRAGSVAGRDSTRLRVGDITLGQRRQTAPEKEK